MGKNTRYKKIGKTTYVVTSVFNPNAHSDVTDKIARLIEREAYILLEPLIRVQ